MLSPEAQIQSVTTELRGKIQRAGHWSNLFAKGKRPLTKAKVNQFINLMTDGSGRTVMAYLLTFVGVILYPSGLHLDFSPEVHVKLGRSFPLPEVYKVRNFFTSLIIASLICS